MRRDFQPALSRFFFLKAEATEKYEEPSAEHLRLSAEGSGLKLSRTAHLSTELNRAGGSFRHEEELDGRKPSAFA